MSKAENDGYLPDFDPENAFRGSGVVPKLPPSGPERSPLPVRGLVSRLALLGGFLKADSGIPMVEVVVSLSPCVCRDYQGGIRRKTERMYVSPRMQRAFQSLAWAVVKANVEEGLCGAEIRKAEFCSVVKRWMTRDVSLRMCELATRPVLPLPNPPLPRCR